MATITIGSNSFAFSAPKTKAQKLALFEEQIISSYIAPKRNKHIFSVLSHNEDDTFFFGPDYIYGTDTIYEQEQIIETGGKGCECELIWKDLIVDDDTENDDVAKVGYATVGVSVVV